MRQCMGCNERKPKSELVRIVRSPEGEIALDFTGKKNGRGAYLCRSVACLRRVAKSHRIDRVLECTVPEAVYQAMEQEIASHEAD